MNYTATQSSSHSFAQAILLNSDLVLEFSNSNKRMLLQNCFILFRSALIQHLCRSTLQMRSAPQQIQSVFNLGTPSLEVASTNYWSNVPLNRRTNGRILPQIPVLITAFLPSEPLGSVSRNLRRNFFSKSRELLLISWIHDGVRPA